VPIVDLGLRLEDAEAMGLEAEAVKVDNAAARRETLELHGATEAEIEFLAEPDDDGMCRRVELNAMTSRQLVNFVEAKLEEYNVKKVVPESGALTQHARRLVEQTLTRAVLQRLAGDIARHAAEGRAARESRRSGSAAASPALGAVVGPGTGAAHRLRDYPHLGADGPALTIGARLAVADG
jgi:hypothetical protein